MEIINEILISGIIFHNILKINIYSLLNILDIYSYKGVFGFISYLFVSIGLALSSFIVALKILKNKEKTFIKCEFINEEV